jgi:ketosteroid isomerase-like protein
MSQENVELVRESFERWNRGDRDFSRAEVLHPDFQVVSRMPSEPFRGLEGLRRWMQEIDEQFEEWKVVVTELRDAGDQVVALGAAHLRGKGSGVPYEQSAGWLFEFQGDKLIRLQMFARPEEALEAAGLRE